MRSDDKAVIERHTLDLQQHTLDVQHTLGFSDDGVDVAGSFALTEIHTEFSVIRVSTVQAQYAATGTPFWDTRIYGGPRHGDHDLSWAPDGARVMHAMWIMLIEATLTESGVPAIACKTTWTG